MPAFSLLWGLSLPLFLFGYPILQLWTLLRCRGGWRAASFLCLIPSGPLYMRLIWEMIDPVPGGLFGLVIIMYGSYPVLYLFFVMLGDLLLGRKDEGRGKPKPSSLSE